MGVCPGTKRNGTSCTVIVEPSKQYCWWHDPAYAAKRSRSASKAGKSKPNREVADLKAQLEDLAEGVLEKRIDRGDAIAVNQILNTRARLIELERKIKETEELEQRISAIEQRQSFNTHRGGPKTW